MGSRGRARGDQDTVLEATEGKSVQPMVCTSLLCPQCQGALTAVSSESNSTCKARHLESIPAARYSHTPSSGPGLLFLICEPLKVTFGAVRGDFFFFFCPVLRFLSTQLRSHWLLTICLSYFPCLVANVQHGALSVCSEALPGPVDAFYHTPR